MNRDCLLRISRLASEAEALAYQVRNGQGIRDALHLAQLAVARQLERMEAVGREAPPEPAPEPSPPLSTAVLARLRTHLLATGHGAQARLARQTGLPQSTLSKFRRTGLIGKQHLVRLSAALALAEAEEQS